MNELTALPISLLAKVQKNELGDLLKPLIKEIYLTDTYVAGILFKDEPPLDDLKEGDELFLRKEKTLYDEHTVNVCKKDGMRLGELPEYNNEIFARLLEAGKSIKAKIKLIEISPSFQTIVISLFLLDFCFFALE